MGAKGGEGAVRVISVALPGSQDHLQGEEIYLKSRLPRKYEVELVRSILSKFHICSRVCMIMIFQKSFIIPNKPSRNAGENKKSKSTDWLRFAVRWSELETQLGDWR